MAKLIMCKGLPGSGKSTWARTQGSVVIVNKDDIRAGMNRPWSREMEKDVIKERDRLIAQALKMGLKVISDDTNLASKHKQRLNDLARRFGAEWEVKDFTDVPIEECIRRDSQREGAARVGEKVIIEMAQQFLQFKPEVKLYVPNFSLPNVVICDLDGTLCLHHGRGPFDYDRCDTDLPNMPVLVTLYAMKSRGYMPIFISGREDSCREKTQEWLNRFDFRDRPLYMRRAGDFRKDSVIKGEIFDTHIRGKFNVLYCLDDRQQVVDFYRSIGLTVFQVAPGDF